MRKAAKQILVCAAALLLLCIVCRFTCFNQFSVYFPLIRSTLGADGQITGQLQSTQPDVLRIGEAERQGSYLRVPVYPENPGETDLIFGSEDGLGDSVSFLRVNRFHTVYDRGSGNFTGDTGALISITLFCLLVSAIMIWHFFQARGIDFYDYSTIYYAGFSLFALATGLTLLRVTISRLTHPESFGMYYAYSAIRSASWQYMLLTTPLLLLFAGAMLVSNIVLLRHERRSLKNGLGLLISIGLVLGEALGWFLFTRDFMGSELEGRILETFENTYATIFIYFQCMLTGAVISGIKAARHKPDPDKDFIIILGCWFRKDGTLPPLLRGRADKALDFWRSQKEKTGKEALFIPSGGQGSNEPMPEAEAMRQYLLSQGIDDRLILPEKQSANTWQNMTFSEEIIRETNPEGKAVFATSSYHVFRSGVWARQAGLPAEGLGSKTKWWYWPNAFMRETIGLLQKRWKQELLFLILLILLFGILSMVL